MAAAYRSSERGLWREATALVAAPLGVATNARIVRMRRDAGLVWIEGVDATILDALPELREKLIDSR